MRLLYLIFLALVADPANAAPPKRIDMPGYAFSQLTDNDLPDQRPVVNDFEDIAWQVFEGGLDAGILAEVDGQRFEITLDAGTVRDRYPAAPI